MAENILVTGGAGAIGSWLTKSLISCGFSVTVLDDLSSGRTTNVPKDVRFVQGTITSDDDISRAFSVRPKYVIHAAALFANQNSVENPEKDLLVNGLGTIKVLEACRRAGTEKVLFLSSSCVYGGKAVMTESEYDYYPETPYAITKLLGERYCQFWSHQHQMDTAIVRLFNTYGPGEHPGKYRNVIPNFIALAMKNEALPITGTGEETRSFIFVEDSVRGILSALFSKTKFGETFNIGSNEQTRILDLANQINQMTGNRAGIEFHPRRNWDTVTTREADTKKAETLLGFSATVSLKEGLEQTYEWLKDNNDSFSFGRPPQLHENRPSLPRTEG